MDYDNASMLRALADETRLKITALLCTGTLCGYKLLEHFDFTQPTLSYHMKILCDCGLVEAVRDGALMCYSLRADGLQALADFFSGMQQIVIQQDDGVDKPDTPTRGHKTGGASTNSLPRQAEGWKNHE